MNEMNKYRDKDNNNCMLSFSFWMVDTHTFNGSQLGKENLISGSGGSIIDPADRFPFFQPPSLLLIDPSRYPPYE